MREPRKGIVDALRSLVPDPDDPLAKHVYPPLPADVRFDYSGGRVDLAVLVVRGEWAEAEPRDGYWYAQQPVRYEEDRRVLTAQLLWQPVSLKGFSAPPVGRNAPDVFLGPFNVGGMLHGTFRRGREILELLGVELLPIFRAFYPQMHPELGRQIEVDTKGKVGAVGELLIDVEWRYHLKRCSRCGRPEYQASLEAPSQAPCLCPVQGLDPRTAGSLGLGEEK